MSGPVRKCQFCGALWPPFGKRRPGFIRDLPDEMGRGIVFCRGCRPAAEALAAEHMVKLVGKSAT